MRFWRRLLGHWEPATPRWAAARPVEATPLRWFLLYVAYKFFARDAGFPKALGGSGNARSRVPVGLLCWWAPGTGHPCPRLSLTGDLAGHRIVHRAHPPYSAEGGAAAQRKRVHRAPQSHSRAPDRISPLWCLVRSSVYPPQLPTTLPGAQPARDKPSPRWLRDGEASAVFGPWIRAEKAVTTN